MDKTYITLLLQRYFTNQATHAEREALFAELEKYKNNEDWVDIHTSLLSEAQEIEGYDPERYQSIIDKILKPDRHHGVSGDDRQHGVSRSGPRVVPMYQRKAFRWIAAAAIIIIIATVALLYVGVPANDKSKQTATIHEIPAPTNTRAVITLADGSKVYLDSANNGTIAQQNNVTVTKSKEGEIVYSPLITTNSLITYNTLFNPRGSKVISLTLSDGTKVWLNSESSLKYPTAFNSKTREVEITGEAYFEVKHNAKQPFKVHLPNGSIVEDIGTAFNINSYADESDTKTTLVEGSVKITNTISGQSVSSVTLRPGEQSTQSISNRAIRVLNNVDLEEVTAWRNGRFQFTGTTIENILKEISRYYDAEIIYQDRIPGEFVADISRDVPVSKLLQILELTNRVHFKVEGKKITVMK